MALSLAAAQLTAPEPVGAPACQTASVGLDGFCTASDGTKLHYVDWGGRGPVIILLAGLGASARAYDDFAPRLARGHRVITITRRGYGLSADAADKDYSNKRLVRDVLDVMDGLRIDRASFVGHSIAGGELASLGADHAARVDRLIYLDAAYDRSPVPVMMAQAPAMPPPAAADLTSIAALARWREGSLGVRSSAVAADLEDIMRVGPAGLTPRTPPTTAAAIPAGDIAAPPRYREIAAPSLALYGSKDVPEQVPALASAAAREAFVAFSVREFRPWMLREKERFVAEQRCGTAYELPKSGHNIFLEHPAWTARTILGFLATRRPCGYPVLLSRR